MNQTKPSPEQLIQSLLDWHSEPLHPDTPKAEFKNLQEEGQACLLLSSIFSFIDSYLKEHGIKPKNSITKQS